MDKIKIYLKRKDIGLFTILFILYMGVTFLLFHRQSVLYGGKYMSDMVQYVRHMDGESTGLTMPYPIMFWLARFFALFVSNKWGIAMAVTVLNGLTPIALYYCYTETSLGKNAGNRGYINILLIFSLLFISMLYLPDWFNVTMGGGMKYAGVFSPNPYHNATYLVARPFAVMTFFFYQRIILEYEAKDAWVCKDYICFSVFLFLTTLAKPSFTLIMVATAGLMMLFRLLLSKFKGIKSFFQFGIWFIPTFLLMIYQYFVVFTSSNPNVIRGIDFSPFKLWSYLTDNIPLAVCLAMSFPIAVMIFQFKKLRKRGVFGCAWFLWLVSFCSFAFFQEKGEQFYAANFAWGYMYGLFFIHAVTLYELVKETQLKQAKIWALAVQWFFFVLHLICGIDYFLIYMSGESYI